MVDSRNATEGTTAFAKGFGSSETKKNITMTMYVSARIKSLRVQLFSQALSASTRELRALIWLISFWREERVGMGDVKIAK